MSRYKVIRIPIEAYENFKTKKVNMEKMLQSEFKWNKKLHMSDALRFFSQKQTVVFPDELAKYLSNTKRRRKFYPIAL